MDIEIRKMRLSDINDVACMWEFFSRERYGTNPDKEAWVAMQYGLLQEPGFISIVAVHDGKLVGFIDGQLKYEPAHSEIHMVGRHSWVEEPYRGEGIGLKLYREFYNIGEAMGAKKFLASSPAEGGPAKAIVKKLFDKDMEQYTVNWIFEV